MRYCITTETKETIMNFRKYMQEVYSKEELSDIANHGCQSGCASTMIYYSDTSALYDEYQDNLHEIIEEATKELGEFPKYIIDNFGDTTQFRNAVVWFCAEYIAYELI
jgi:hypothetical protein